MATVRLNATKHAFVDSASPNSNFSGQASQQIYYERETALLLGFQPLANNLRFRPIISVKAFFYGTVQDDVRIWKLYYSASDFNAGSVTYNTRPVWSLGNSAIIGAMFDHSFSAGPDESMWSIKGDVFGSNASERSADCARVLAAKTIWPTDIEPSILHPKCVVATSSSGNRPYLVVEYGDSNLYGKTTATAPLSGYVNPHESRRFSWSVSKDSTLSCVAEIKQSSAVFSWRRTGATAWNTRTVSGGNNYIDLPADTLPAADGIQWKVAVTDNTGHVSESAVSTIVTADNPFYTTALSPRGGYRINELTANIFRWRYDQTPNNGTSPTKTELQWSRDGSTWQALGTANGNATQMTIAANTFPVGMLYWRARTFNADGTAGPWSAAESFSTVETTTYARAISPIGSVEDASAPITFRWRVENESGAAQQKSELTWTADNGQTWAPRVTVNGAGTSYTYPANTFPAGEIFWSVRAYNRQGAEGPWSNGNRFIAVAAPPTPLVSTNAAPFATIRWQGEGQQAYRLTVDGTELGPFFGADKSYTLEDYLADGPHTVSVSVQGQYGLWSQEGTVSFRVKNTPGRAVTLSGSFDRDAVLSWQTAATAFNFFVYRDSVRIGHTTGTTFSDRLVLGAHEYTVINRLADGNYTRSNTVSGLLCACVTAVAPFSGGPWVDLPLTENSSSEQAYSYSRAHSLRHMSGAALPVLELSPYEDGGGRYDAAFADPAEGRALEALRGQMVIVKSRRGNVVIGALAQLDKREKDFYTAYSFSVERAYWEDYVDDTDD